MKLEVLDSLSIPGNPEKPNDDAFAFIDSAAVVMDGATGLGDQLMPGKSDAAWLSAFGVRRLMAYAREGATARDAVAAALFDAQTSFEALRKRPPAEVWEMPFASMMLAQCGEASLEFLWYGDCAALIARPGEAIEVIGEAFDKRSAEAARVAKIAAYKGVSPAGDINRSEFISSLRRARNMVNSGPHWLFGPDARAADHVASKTIAAPSGTLTLLCSDGFLALASDYGAYTAETLVQAAQSKGLAAMGDELRAIERGDPQGLKHPRFKTSDDATALLLRLD